MYKRQHIAGNKAFIRERADNAAEAYEHAIREGLSVAQALELADTCLLYTSELIRIENDPELKHLLGGDEGVQTTS